MTKLNVIDPEMEAAMCELREHIRRFVESHPSFTVLTTTTKNRSISLVAKEKKNTEIEPKTPSK